jgi:Abortive infection phage resistance protein N-terminal domain
VHGTADAGGHYAEDAFFELFCEQLVEAGELETADRAPYAPPRGMRVDGYGGDPLAADGVLGLIVADFHQSTEVSTLTATDMGAIFKRLSNFLAKSLDASARNQFEESAYLTFSKETKPRPLTSSAAECLLLVVKQKCRE